MARRHFWSWASFTLAFVVLALSIGVATLAEAHPDDARSGEGRRGDETVAAVVSTTPDPLTAVELVRSGELERAVALSAPGQAALAGEGTAPDGRSSDERLRRLGLVHAVVRAARFLDTRDGHESLEALLANAARRARPEDLGLLRALERSSPRVAPYARALARRALDRIGADLDPRVLVDLVRGDDADAKRRALSALGERLGRLHDKVDAGADLDAKEQAELSDPTLLAALALALEERRPELDVLPHDLAATTSPSALHDLALIDMPAVKALEAAKRDGVPGASAALAAAIETARVRLRRHPRSSWSSANGLVPTLVAGAPVCAGCNHPMPAGSRFCPGCGQSAPLAACPRCGAPLEDGVCTRCGSGGQGEAGRCDQCHEPIGAQDLFCHACGAKRAR